MAIMISVNPPHVRNIISKNKTLEIRKSCPKEWKAYLNGKIKVKPDPQKCFIYCTKGKPYLCCLNIDNNRRFHCKNGKVVAEFTLEKIDKLEYRHLSVFHQNAYIPINEDADYEWEKHSCLEYSYIVKYGKLAPLYAWHISNLHIYDEPKSIKEFDINKPPQSWCYCEEANDDN